MSAQEKFFDFAAEVGLTKHIGGHGATRTLLDLCHIAEGMHILDVGCGVGVTPTFIARDYRCHVVGVDISPRMVERSIERARKQGLGRQVEFRTADAQELPFADASFDIVITESVTSFPEDKQRAVGEYVRVTKPGGYVGMNESVWLKEPPPPDVLAWVAQDVGATVRPLSPNDWTRLMLDAGLTDVTARSFPVDVRREGGAIVARYGIVEMLRVIGRMVRLYARSPAYRSFVKSTRETGLTPPNLQEYFGYGLFVGRRASQGT